MKHFSGTLQKNESNMTEECDLDSSTENPLSFLSLNLENECYG